MIINKKINAFWCGVALVGLSACVSILPEPMSANNIYRLSIDQNRAYQKSATPIAIRVDRPKTPQTLRGKDLIATLEDNRVKVIDKAEWSQSLPDQIQSSLLSAINSQNDLVGVIPTSGARSNYRVHITVEKFEAHFDKGLNAAPRIDVAYYVTLAKAGNRNLIGTANFSKSDRAESERVTHIVRTKSDINSDLTFEISQWISSQLSLNKQIN